MPARARRRVAAARTRQQAAVARRRTARASVRRQARATRRQARRFAARSAAVATPAAVTATLRRMIGNGLTRVNAVLNGSPAGGMSADAIKAAFGTDAATLQQYLDAAAAISATPAVAATAATTEATKAESDASAKK